LANQVTGCYTLLAIAWHIGWFINILAYVILIYAGHTPLALLRHAIGIGFIVVIITLAVWSLIGIPLLLL